MLISVIIPCHNCLTTIDRAVNSVFSQTFTDWELILVNNNSTDGTWEKLLQIQKQFPEKSIVILDEKKKGAPAARNKGLFEAKGDWVQFLDADDELLPEKISAQLSLVEKRNMDVIYSPYYKIIDKDGVRTKKIVTINFDVWKALITSNAGITSANLFRREKMLEIKGWNEELTSSQEYNLMFRIAKCDGVFVYDDEPLTYIHFTENSISNDRNKKKIAQRINNFASLRNEMLQEVKRKNNYQDYLKSYNNIIESYCYWGFGQGVTSSLFTYQKYARIDFVHRFKVVYIFLNLLIKIKKDA